jgi:hypothetical protein
MNEILRINYKIFVNIHFKTKKIFIFLKVLLVNCKLFCNLMGQGQDKSCIHMIIFPELPVCGIKSDSSTNRQILQFDINMHFK